MKLKIYQVDAFTDKIFGGNPAAVCPLDNWIDKSTMQSIAAENNLAETAFFIQKDKGEYEIRWFMPYDEVDLCGHATLASAFVIFNFIEKEISEIQFHSQSGILKAMKGKHGIIHLNFPSRPPTLLDIPEEVFQAFNHTPIEAAGSRDLLLLFNSEEEIKTLQYNLKPLKDLPYLCTIATAKAKTVDFVSRVFDANGTLPEDPVTGSAHCSLIPYWQKKLNKNSFNAKQLSARGGELKCEIKNDRVFIGGNAALYLEGNIFI